MMWPPSIFSGRDETAGRPILISSTFAFAFHSIELAIHESLMQNGLIKGVIEGCEMKLPDRIYVGIVALLYITFLSVHLVLAFVPSSHFPGQQTFFNVYIPIAGQLSTMVAGVAYVAGYISAFRTGELNQPGAVYYARCASFFLFFVFILEVLRLILGSFVVHWP